MGEVKGGSMAAILNAPAGKIEGALKEASKIGYVDIAKRAVRNNLDDYDE